MFNDLPPLPKFIIRSLSSLFVIVAATTCCADEPRVDPQVQSLIDKHLRADPTYSPGDILSRAQVEPIYNDILSRGLKPTREAESAYSPILRDTHFLVMLLRTPQGRAFMKKSADRPLTYDRLDRLSWLPGGQDWARQIVASEEGVELLDRLFSEAGIEALKQQFPNDSQTENLGRPTGKIYTETALGAALTKTLRQQMQAKAKSATASRPGAAPKPKQPSGA